MKQAEMIANVCLLVMLTFVSKGLSFATRIQKPRQCNNEENTFRHRRSYVYNYNLVFEAGFSGLYDITNGSDLQCIVNIFVPKPCEVIMKLNGCILHDLQGEGSYTMSSRSNELAADLERNDLYLQISNGKVLQHRLVVAENEPTYIINIKRAIISQLQLPSFQDVDNDVIQHDILGECPMHVAFNATTRSFSTSRDLTLCKVPKVFRSTQSILSLVRQMHMEHSPSPISTLMYPYRSFVTCHHSLTSRLLSMVMCHQSQVFQPLTYNSQLQSTEFSNITQILTFKNKQKLQRITINREMKGRRYVPIAMEIEEDPENRLSPSQIHQMINSIVEAHSQYSQASGAGEFMKLATALRSVRKETLEEIFQDLYDCKQSTAQFGCHLKKFPSHFQSPILLRLSESVFTDGLLSCGTEECIVVYLKCFEANMVKWTAGQMAIFNMALFYNPSPAVVSSMLKLCRKEFSVNCWLSLGSLARKLAQAVSADAIDVGFRHDGNAVLLEIFDDLSERLASSCSPVSFSDSQSKESHQKISDALLIIKTLGNIGDVVQHLHDRLDEHTQGHQLVPRLLACLLPNQPKKISNAAMMAVSKMAFDQLIVSSLFDVLTDSGRPVALRSAAFDRLVLNQDEWTILRLLDFMSAETLQGLRMYMTTRIGHLLECIKPETTSLRQYWRSALRKRPLPELESFRVRGSKYYDFCSYFIMPFSKTFLGGSWVVNVVYDPASLVPENLRVSLELVLSNRSQEIIDVGLHMHGLDNIVREVMMKGLRPEDGIGALAARIVQAMLPKRGQVPKFFFSQQNVVSALQSLMAEVNQPNSDTPTVELLVRLLGRDVGYVYLDDFIRMLAPQHPPAFNNVNQGFTFFQELKKGLQLQSSKALTILEMRKSLPTIAGLVWTEHFQIGMVLSGSLNANGDLNKFLSRKGPLEVFGDFVSRFDMKLTKEANLKLAGISSTGTLVNMSVMAQGKMINGSLYYSKWQDSKRLLNSRNLKLSFRVSKKPEKLLAFKHDLLVLRDGQPSALGTPGTQVTTLECSSLLIRKWTGHSVCWEGFYQNFTSVQPAYTPPLLIAGPAHIDITAQRTDMYLDHVNISFLLKNNKNQRQRTLEISASAPGKIFNRSVNILMTHNAINRDLHVISSIPELGLHYSLNLSGAVNRRFQFGHVIGRNISSVLTIDQELVHAFIMETKNVTTTTLQKNNAGNIISTSNTTEILLRFNVSFPGLSFDALASSHSNMHDRLRFISIRYYCDPSRSLLYALHMRPDIAAESGHLSEFTLSNNATMMYMNDMKSVWVANDTIVVLIPGHQVTIHNRMSHTPVLVTRNTTTNWLSNVGLPEEEEDVIKMDSEAWNHGKDGLYDLVYRMHVVGNYCRVEIDSTVYGPITDFLLTTSIRYVNTSNVDSINRRSKRGIFNQLGVVEHRIKDGLNSVEKSVMSRGAQISKAILGWFSYNGSKRKDEDNYQVSKDSSAAEINPLLSLLHLPEWTLEIQFLSKLKRQSRKYNSNPSEARYSWDLNVTMPDILGHVISFNGTVIEEIPFRPSIGGYKKSHMSSKLFNFSLDYYHNATFQDRNIFINNIFSHQCNGVYRTWDIMLDWNDLSFPDYSFNLTLPTLCITHNLSTLPSSTVDVLDVSHKLHVVRPHWNILLSEDLTSSPQKLSVKITLNSTWLDLHARIVIDFSMPDVFTFDYLLQSFEKVSWLKGNQLFRVKAINTDSLLSVNLTHRSSIGKELYVYGTMTEKDAVQLAFHFSPSGSSSNIKLLDWNLTLLEPTLLSNHFRWNSTYGEDIFRGVFYFYTTGAFAFKVFGETVADNVHRNITDWLIPFLNLTVSESIDRIVGSSREQPYDDDDGGGSLDQAVWQSKVLKGGIDLLHELQTSFRTSVMGKGLAFFGLPTLYSGWVRLSTGLFYTVVKDPPPFVRQHMKFYVIPSIRKALQNSYFTFNFPLNFVWEDFLSLPKSRAIFRQLQLVRRVQGDYLKDGRPFSALLTRHHVYSFDNVQYDYTVPTDRCVYLLATDLISQKYAIVMTRRAATIIMSGSYISIGWDGSISANDGHRRRYDLPLTVNKEFATVSLFNGQLVVDIYDETLLTYDILSKLFYVEIGRSSHNGSIGLLGTNTRESSDEFRLRDGSITTEAYRLQDEYELSGYQSCQLGPAGAVSSGFGCMLHNAILCYDLFRDADTSPLSPCFSTVNPEKFADLCLSRVCSIIPQQPKERCPVVQTYINLCAREGLVVSVSSPAFVKDCGVCNDYDDDNVDVVLASSLSHTSSLIMNTVKLIATEVDGSVRFGLIYGRHANAHIFMDGQLFTTSDQFKDLSLQQLRKKETGSKPDAIDILLTATHYPYRSNSRHILVLFSRALDSEMPDERLVRSLQDNGIAVIIISPDLESRGVVSITLNNTIVCNGCDREKVTVPQAGLLSVVQPTQGAWMSLDTLQHMRGKFGQVLRRITRVNGFDLHCSQPA